MERRLKIITLLLLCFSTIFLSGCWDQKIFERIGFILQLGLEIDKDGNLLYSSTLPVVSEDIKEKVEILSSSGDMLRESRENIRNVAGKRVEGGKAQHIHFSRELAEKGIGELLDVFLRNPENPLLANMIVVEGSPLEMFQKSLNYKDKPRVAYYVTQLIDDAHKRTATPEARAYRFTILQHSKTIDPLATYMRYNDMEIEVAGTALFSGDKMVGTIDTEQTGILSALMGERINFDYFYKEQGKNSEGEIKNGASLLFRQAKTKVKIDVSGSLPKIDFTIDIRAALEEYEMVHDLDKPEAKKKLEEEVEKAFQKDCMKLIEQLQKLGTDPIGFGEMIRAKYNSYFRSVDWKKIYPKASINVSAKVNIEFYGAVN